MNGLQIIYLIGAAALGLFSGMLIELMVDARTIADLQEANRKLKLEKQQLKGSQHVEVIEITDNRGNDRQPETNYFKPF